MINQPIFSTRKVTTSVSIWDGQTVALGGLVREDVQKVQDKVPILGDIPLAGRLFRSNVDQKIKRNLIIFVTARLMDAEGRPVRLDEDTEEIVEPLGLPQELPPPTFESPELWKIDFSKVRENNRKRPRLRSPRSTLACGGSLVGRSILHSFGMPIVGITGGIASGKSTFRNLLLQCIRADSFDADACVSELLENDESVRKQILKEIHPDAYGAMASRIARCCVSSFIKRSEETSARGDPAPDWCANAGCEKRKKLRALEEFSSWIFPFSSKQAPKSLFDRIITVGCTVETQLARLTRRPGMTPEISEKIIASQMPIGLKIFRSHHVIWNDGALDALIAQTTLFSRYLHDRYS